MSSGEEKGPGFVVSDRRGVGSGGETRPEGAPAAEMPEMISTAESAAAEFSADATRPGGAAEFSADATRPGAAALHGAKTTTGGDPLPERLPPVDFSTFVLSLGSSVLMHLGEIENPSTGTTSKNLAMAKHTVDILSMLQEKTRNNLATNEAELLENLLYDLRLRFVNAAKPRST
jgi:hypothetical protein